MNKLVVMGCAALMVAGAFAAENAKDDSAATAAIRQERFLKSTGGKVARPGTQKGEVVYVNCQKLVPAEWIEEVMNYFVEATHFKLRMQEGSFDLKQPGIVGNATLFIVDDPTLPPILVAPESRWTAVNMATVAQEKRPAFFQARAKKEISRGFAYLCGAANSQYPQSLTRSIVSQSDLDKNVDYKLPVDMFGRFRTYMETLGVTPAQITIYRKACEQGWAPKPENEYQQAIWDKVHEIPSEPIKIKYEKPAAK